jgi:hypothetical protein
MPVFISPLEMRTDSSGSSRFVSVGKCLVKRITV